MGGNPSPTLIWYTKRTRVLKSAVARFSFPVKYVHPHSVRDIAHPVRKSGQRITGAGVCKQGMKSINGEMVMCVFVHHNDFTDEAGEPVDIWVKKSHVKIEKEGNPEMF